MTQGSRRRRLAGWALLVLGLATLCGLVALLRLSLATDHLYSALVKDPERAVPAGRVLVAPADGTVLYVRRIADGVIPRVVKRGVAVPVVEHVKGRPARPCAAGWLIGIYMNTQGVHLNRAPSAGVVRERIVFNGPHMDMTDLEAEIIVAQLVPGLVTVKKLLGLEPFDIEDRADFVLESARETLVLEDERGQTLYVVRIADYYVGKILTWVAEGERVERGEKLGMITWGSQTDLFVEDGPGLEIAVAAGEYVYAGETVVARY